MRVVDGRYEIDRPLAAGHHFQSFAGHSLLTNEPVFVKIEHDPERQANDGVAEAHLSHWQTLERVRIPGVPAILDFGREDARAFVVTEWVAGETLRTLLRAPDPSSFPPYFLDVVMEECLRILARLHVRGILHGDISPGNIMVGHGHEVHLIDLAPVEALYRNGVRGVIGTPPYMSPNVIDGGKRMPSDDVFALERVMEDAARMLGRRPPLGSRAAAVREPARAPPPPPAMAARAAPPQEMGLLARLRRLLPVSRRSPTPPRGDAAAPLAPTGPENKASRERWEAGTSRVPTGRRAAPQSTRDNWEQGTVQRRPDPMEGTRRNWNRASHLVSAPIPRPDGPTTTRADFVVFAPEYVRAGRHFFVELWVATDGRYEDLMREAMRGGRLVERGGRRYVDVARDLLLTVTLKLPDFEVEQPIETLGWSGDICNVGFMVKAPAALRPDRYPGTIKLAQNQIPFASIAFDLEVAADDNPDQPNGPRRAEVHRIAQAFASYAQQDRAEVLRRVQGMSAIGTDVFVDVVSQRSGTTWQDVLFQKIDESDALLLFWSRYAARSTWVDLEWRYALAQHGIDFIHPVPLADPREVAPPPELAAKHFDDPLRPHILTEDMRRADWSVAPGGAPAADQE